MGKESNEHSSSYSWWLGSHNQPNQSQWLHSTLSDLDKKVKTIMNVLEDDGDSFAKRADVYFQRRPELIKMVEDLHKSYRSMALKLDQLRPESSTEAANSFRKFQIGRSESAELLQAPKPHPELDGLEEEREERWEELREKVAKLIEENLRYQAELIRRNDEKRKAIKVLCARIGRLAEENRALKSCVARSVVDSKETQSNLSRMKGAFLGKLLR